ncbi:hypothetical protein CAP36_15055 [Chitinophagaceae bacterium IBVUCB2]|nr:hypothetical protein CAP36_15055 [Chitinophagaceae bacterium IBVUCB2]
MRKITAVILLLVFFIAQYEKHIGYVNCRVTNYFTTDANTCDCESFLENNGAPLADNTIPPIHIHHHPDESYCTPVNDKISLFFNLITSFPVQYIPGLPSGNVYSIDHPPQLS